RRDRRRLRHRRRYRRAGALPRLRSDSIGVGRNRRLRLRQSAIMQRLSGNKGLPSQDAELSVELLRRNHPEVLSRWVSIGIAAVFVGYGISALGLYLTQPPGELLRRPDLWAIGCAIVALWLHRHGRVRAAGALVLVPGWFEQH